MKSLGGLRFEVWILWVFKIVFKTLLVPTDMFTEHVNKYLRKTKGPKHSDIELWMPYVGVNIRLGHGTNELEDWRFRHQLPLNSTARYLAQQLIREANDKQMQSPKFFQSTDSVKLRKSLRYEVHSLDSQAIVYHGTWDVKHLNNMSSSDEDLNL